MNDLKLFHVADLHLDSPFDYLPTAEAENRRKLQRYLLQSIADIAQEKGAQALLLSGDIFDGDRVETETQRTFCRVLGGLAMPVFVICGNHDPYTPSSVWAGLELPENVHLFRTEAFETLNFPELNARFWGSSFENVFCRPMLKIFKAPEKIDGIFDIMLLHGNLSSGYSDYCTITKKELEECGMDYVALGHIHAGSGLQQAGKTAFAYPGCPEGRGYDELGEKGGLLVTISDEGVRTEFVALGSTRYEIFQLEVSDEPIEKLINRAISDLTENCYCRIILKGEAHSPLDLAMLRREFAGRLKELQLRDETTERRDIWAQLGNDSLAGLFLQKLRAKLDETADENERKKIELAAAYGLKALENGGENL